jgi:hypothetical protein
LISILDSQLKSPIFIYFSIEFNLAKADSFDFIAFIALLNFHSSSLVSIIQPLLYPSVLAIIVIHFQKIWIFLNIFSDPV